MTLLFWYKRKTFLDYKIVAISNWAVYWSTVTHLVLLNVTHKDGFCSLAFDISPIFIILMNSGLAPIVLDDIIDPLYLKKH